MLSDERKISDGWAGAAREQHVCKGTAGAQSSDFRSGDARRRVRDYNRRAWKFVCDRGYRGGTFLRGANGEAVDSRQREERRAAGAHTPGLAGDGASRTLRRLVARTAAEYGNS